MKRWWTTSWYTVGVFITPATSRPPRFRWNSRAPPLASAIRWRARRIEPTWRGDHGKPFFGFIFDPEAEGQADPADLRGGARAPDASSAGRRSSISVTARSSRDKRIDTRISTPLFNLPLRAIASGDPPTSLAQRNLLRHQTWSFRPGSESPTRCGSRRCAPQDLGELAGYGLGLERSTPLWYYILKEADLIGGGQHLGPVGGRIVGEVLLGLLETDRDSFCGQNPTRHDVAALPALGELPDGRSPKFAGEDPASRGQ